MIPPRICMLSARGPAPVVHRCALVECEQLLTELEAVEVFHPSLSKRSGVGNWLQSRLMWHDFTGRVSRTNWAYEPIRLERDYELLFAHFSNPWDLFSLSALKGWQRRCATSVCWIDELWISALRADRWMWPILRDFDHVIVNLQASATPLGEILGRTCHFVPAGVDAIRFNPYPDAPQRVIDLYSIGRRWPALHDAAQNYAAENKLFYVFDSLDARDVTDYREHRVQFANMAKRSRFMFVAPAKMDQVAEHQGQREIAHRYFEGAAAGAVLLGQTPGCEHFSEFFNWPDAVVEVAQDGSDLGDALSHWLNQPDRLAEISRRNARNVLLQHDWVYRLKEIFRIAGVQPGPRFAAREALLRQTAEALA